MEERRRSTRFRIGQLIEVSFGRENFLEATGINISEHGMLCETSEPADPGTNVYLVLQIRGDAPRKADGTPEQVQLEGFVSRSQKVGDTYQVGVEFAELPDAASREALSRIVAAAGERDGP